MEDLEPHAVGNYMLNGLSGLEMKYSTGAKRKLNKNQEIHMVEVIMTRLIYLMKLVLKEEKIGL